MKKIILFFIAVLNAVFTFACPVCERQQPKLLRGITHGAGPQGEWDYVIVCTMVAITILTLFFSVKWLIKPGERSSQHIKHFISNME